jgi:IS5 family transposase
MFKVLILQALYGLSDERAEFQLRDQLSFMRFVGFEMHEPVPALCRLLQRREGEARRRGAGRHHRQSAHETPTGR